MASRLGTANALLICALLFVLLDLTQITTKDTRCFTGGTGYIAG